MTGNIAIDVAIGLVFIYTLYSLLTSTIVEFIAASFQLRAKNLKLAIRRMLDDDEINVLADKFNSTPIVKYLASNRFSFFFFKINKYPSYMNAASFSQALIYLLKDKAKTDAPPAQIIRSSLEEYKQTETGKYLLFLFDEVNGDLEKFKQSVEKWFDLTMERSSGWYKKNVTFITLCLGLIMAMLFNIDTFKMVKQLSNDPKAREQYVQMAGQMINNPVFNNVSQVFDTTLSIRLHKDSLLLKRLGNNRTAFEKFINDSVSHSISVTQKRLIDRMNDLYSQSQSAQRILSFKRLCTPNWFFEDWENFLGCLVTAIALSLGASFWFDLLNKLMKLRSSITSSLPVDNNPKGTQSDDNLKPAVG